MSRSKTVAAIGGLAVAGAVTAAYVLVVRPWQLRWGATDEEVGRPMPGDDIVEDPTFNATRAVTVNTRSEYIWPWLVQVGFGRAGWYSYDWIDNLGKASAGRIIPELQNLKVGDMVPMGPGEVGMRVKAFEPDRWLLWGGDDGKSTWVWGLYPIDEEHTRLVSRVRLAYDWTSPSIIFNLALDVGDIVMMRKMMLGIKQRAEKRARGRAATA